MRKVNKVWHDGVLAGVLFLLCCSLRTSFCSIQIQHRRSHVLVNGLEARAHLKRLNSAQLHKTVLGGVLKVFRGLYTLHALFDFPLLQNFNLNALSENRNRWS